MAIDIKSRLQLSRWTRPQVLLCGALFLMLIAYASRVKSDLNFVDESFYYNIALHLRHLHAFSLSGADPTAIRPPGYPWFIAVVQTIHEGVRFAKMANLLLWFVAALLTAGITRQLFGQRSASFALGFAGLYVVELYTAGALYPQALASVLFLLSLWLHFVWSRSGEWIEAVWQACTWAALILVVPTFLINFLVYLCWLAWTRRNWAQIALTLVLVAAPLAAWSARNQEVFHRPVFVSDNSGEMLFYGNSAATGMNTGPQVPIWLMAPEAAAQSDELTRESGYKQAAIAWIVSNPRRASLLYLEKVVNWFNYQTNLYTAGKNSHLYEFVIAATYYPLLVLAFFAFLLRPDRRRVCTLFAVQYLAAATGYAIFFTRIRYRLPYDYLLMILAGAAAAILIERLRSGTASLSRQASAARDLSAVSTLEERQSKQVLLG